MAPFDRSHTSSYSPSIVTTVYVGDILYRLRDIATYWQKIAKFYTPPVFSAPHGVTPSEFREDVWTDTVHQSQTDRIAISISRGSSSMLTRDKNVHHLFYFGISPLNYDLQTSIFFRISVLGGVLENLGVQDFSQVTVLLKLTKHI